MDQVKRILLLAPHDDDITISFGGLIYDSIKKGYQVSAVIFACGGPCSNVPVEIREKEFKNVMKFYGVEDYDIYTGLDGKLDTVPNCSLTGQIDKLVEDYKPTDLYCTADSAHADHHALYKAFMASNRLRVGWMPANIYLGEYQFLPATYVQNVGGKEYLPLTEDNFNKKIEAFKMHVSQLKPSPSPLGVEGLTTLAKMRGMEIGENYAEMYYQIRRIRYDYKKD